ncbi:oligosaccharide flippase family protein [Fulvivirga sedimenti]|uniref:Oligosaccharide flippase family protein n=1 Tax=Fulvivirga sedimenti TaxID=2879465 RepID=A0A9X1L1L8_9BACT|nr:oligosaccharide flippase family protein [Fulvivirga sedimenti]MCA6078362.1 oligosaccharide flippase family protein [Fulvivirga sedimenti]
MSILKKVTFVFGAEVINILASFLITPYLSRSLSVEDNGTYNQALYLGILCAGILQLGMARVILTSLEAKPSGKNRVFWNNFNAVVSLGVFGLLVLLFFRSEIANAYSNQDLIPLLTLIAVALPFKVGLFTLNSILVHAEKVRTLARISVFFNVLKLLSLFVCIQYFNSVYLCFVALLAIDILMFLVTFYCLPNEYLRPWHFDWEGAKYQLKLALPLGMGSIILVLFNQTDRVMMSIMKSTEDFAIFHNGTIAIPFIGVLFTSIATIVLPELSKLEANDKRSEMTLLKRRVIHFSSYTTFPIICSILLFAPVLIPLYLSDKYVDSAGVFIIFNLVLFFRVNNYQDVLVAASKTRSIFTISLLSLLLNIALNYLLIPTFNYYGAAAASLLSNIILMALLFREGLRVLNARLEEVFSPGILLRVLLISVLCSSLFGLIYFILPYNLLLLILVPGAIISSYFMLWKLGIIETDFIALVRNKFPVLNRFK